LSKQEWAPSASTNIGGSQSSNAKPFFFTIDLTSFLPETTNGTE
jgi:hypothetical protein